MRMVAPQSKVRIRSPNESVCGTSPGYRQMSQVTMQSTVVCSPQLEKAPLRLRSSSEVRLSSPDMTPVRMHSKDSLSIPIVSWTTEACVVRMPSAAQSFFDPVHREVTSVSKSPVGRSRSTNFSYSLGDSPEAHGSPTSPTSILSNPIMVRTREADDVERSRTDALWWRGEAERAQANVRKLQQALDEVWTEIEVRIPGCVRGDVQSLAALLPYQLQSGYQCNISHSNGASISTGPLPSPRSNLPSPRSQTSRHSSLSQAKEDCQSDSQLHRLAAMMKEKGHSQTCEKDPAHKAIKDAESKHNSTVKKLRARVEQLERSYHLLERENECLKAERLSSARLKTSALMSDYADKLSANSGMIHSSRERAGSSASVNSIRESTYTTGPRSPTSKSHHRPARRAMNGAPPPRSGELSGSNSMRKLNLSGASCGGHDSSLEFHTPRKENDPAVSSDEGERLLGVVRRLEKEQVEQEQYADQVATELTRTLRALQQKNGSLQEELREGRQQLGHSAEARRQLEGHVKQLQEVRDSFLRQAGMSPAGANDLDDQKDGASDMPTKSSA